MPTYEYKCGNCNYKFEKFQNITANPIRRCPKCGKLKLKRLIGPGSGIIFRGPGFYCNDYPSEKHKEDSKGDSKNG